MTEEGRDNIEDHIDKIIFNNLISLYIDVFLCTCISLPNMLTTEKHLSYFILILNSLSVAGAIQHESINLKGFPVWNNLIDNRDTTALKDWKKQAADC